MSHEIGDLTPPPRGIKKFTTVWKDWLYYVYEKVEKLTPAYGSIESDGSNTQTFTDNVIEQCVGMWSSNGPSKNTTVDYTAGTITINYSGVYEIFLTGNPTLSYFVEQILYIDGSPTSVVDGDGVGFSVQKTLTEDEVLSIWSHWASGGSKSLRQITSFSVHKIG